MTDFPPLQFMYSSLATASARQCNTCYGRDGTIASSSINAERGSAALVLTRKQKAIARLSVSFQQGGSGFRILLTFTLFVQPLGLDLFAWINEINSPFQNSDNMLSKVARKDDNLPPRKKTRCSLGYAAEWKLG